MTLGLPEPDQEARGSRRYSTWDSGPAGLQMCFVLPHSTMWDSDLKEPENLVTSK